MKTRKQYLAKEVSFREYYAQFVTPEVKALVAKRFTLARLKASTNPHLNGIPLQEWDAIWAGHNRNCIYPGPEISALLEETGEGNSLSTGVCILKEAARQLIEES